MRCLVVCSIRRDRSAPGRCAIRREIRRGPTYGALQGVIQAVVVAAALLGLTGMVCAQTPRPLTLVALGDSLTAGYGLPERAAFPAVLESALRADGWRVTVMNAGVSGDTASDGLARLDWSVGKDADAVLLELGANDMLRGINPAVTRTALDSIVAKLKARGVKTMIAGMYASPTLGKEYVSAFQSIYPDLSKKYGAPLYPFFLSGVAGSPSLELADGMHPNVQGVQTIVAKILPSVESFLRTVGGHKED